MSGLIALIIFGIIQGITEFLPVSSSGHLSLFQYFSSSLGEDLSLSIAVHVGTLFTVIVYYRSDLAALFSGLIRKDRESWTMAFLIVTASIPTAIIGLFMKKKADWILTNPVVAASCLLVTAFILYLSGKIKVYHTQAPGFGIGFKKALLIGTVQGLAVLPGISRSGSTIVMGLFLNMAPHNAARFSFLISLPAIFGAALLEFLDMGSGIDGTRLIVGGMVSFITGLFAISLMVRLTLGGKLKSFSLYLCLVSFGFFLCYFAGIGENFL